MKEYADPTRESTFALYSTPFNTINAAIALLAITCSMTMVPRNRWRCLLRPSFFRKSRIELPSFSANTGLISTSSSLGRPAATTRNASSIAIAKGATNLRIKKKPVVKSGRPPAPGERKALRKRIVLSNPNALEVKEIQDLDAESIAVDSIGALKGRIVSIPGESVDQLRAAEAFKPSQRWGRFRRPGTLMTKESVAMGKILEDVEGGHKTARRVITGEKGTGKSMLLLQAMAMAFRKGWIVISVPEAQDLTIGHTDYSPLANSNPTSYLQKTYLSSLLNSIRRANAPVLSELTLSQKHSLPIPLQSNISLDRLASLGASDPDLSWPIYNALWLELNSPSRPPILYCLDGLAHIMRPTAYLDAVNYQPIHAHDLSIVQHFLHRLSGRVELANGGVVLAATSASNQPSVPTLKIVLQQNEGRSTRQEDASTEVAELVESRDSKQDEGIFKIPEHSPFEPLDPRVLEVMTDVDVIRLRGLDRADARALLEYYASSGVMRTQVDDNRVAEMWAVSGGGVVGEIERGILGG
ncbi:MAG: 37S ribosomal protein S23 mitochondrial [Sclerophora amabilis]|nr:MAG: 37S ribosomal protein S23 mitochondrial [Sclerophora amabilis]